MFTHRVTFVYNKYENIQNGYISRAYFMNQHQRILLHLSLLKSAPASTHRVLHYLGNNLSHIYDMSEQDFINLKILPKVAKNLVNGLSDYVLLDCELDFIDKYKIKWVTLFDNNYPELLKNIHLPPFFLYYKGVLPDSQSLAVIGSREAQSYAQSIINSIVPQLVGNGWTIVSGGAFGADTMAHRAAIQTGGKTVAVLGSGLLKPYPAENKALFEQMVDQGGAVISTFSLLADPIPEHFPDRNRVISGLSKGCLVIQAATKSGARITADFCLAQGRDVFAVPGNLWDPLSAGCHQLIQQGAKLTTNASDILAEYGQKPVTIEVKETQQTTEIHGRAIEVGIEDIIDKKLVALCARACSVDELIDGTGLPLIQLTGRLFDLQLKGILTQNMAGLWECR